MATSEVTAAGETHQLSRVAYTNEALAGTTSWVQQQLPDAIHADGALQLQWCLFEMFFRSFE